MENGERGKVKKIWLIVGISAFVLLLGAYFIMVGYARTHFLPGILINKNLVSGMTTDEVKALLKEQGSKYSLKIHFRGSDVTVDEKDIRYVRDYSKEVDRIRAEHNPFLWFLDMQGKEEQADYVMTYDESLLQKLLFEKGYIDTDKMKQPENPSVVYEDGTYVIVENDEGNLLEPDEVMAAINQAVKNEEGYFNVEEAGFYKTASYNSETEVVKKCVEKANRYLNSDIVYTMGEMEIPLTKDELSEMINIGKDYSCSLSSFKIGIYVQNFADHYDTYKKPKRFTTYYGRTINYEGENYGWKIDVEDECRELKNDILRGEPVKREPNLDRWAETLRIVGNQLDDIGGTYAEVDIGNQHMWMYVNGRVVMDSDFVSGNTALGRGTPGGIFRLTYKERDTFLVGEDYRTHVDYWMPFNGGIGFHDANWRGSFGGTIYQYDGSHGCVNLPIPAAATLYDYVYGGMPVVVY